MRENMGLYRGKRKDNGEWVEGDLFHNHDGRVFVGELVVDDYTEGRTADRYTLGINFVEVDPETVGQFTGFYDSTKWEDLTPEEQEDFLHRPDGWENTPDVWTGKQIFEGDIIKTRHGIRYIVFEDGCFGAKPNVSLFADLRSYNRELNGEWNVIGNVHDDRELLEVK